MTAAVADGVRPIVISTLVNTEISGIVSKANALFLDSFEIFIDPLERELGVKASHAVGRSHSTDDFVQLPPPNRGGELRPVAR